MVPLRQNGAEAPRPTGGSPWPSIVHASESAATREPRRHARRRPGTASRGLARPGATTTARWPSGRPTSRGRPTARARAAARIRAGAGAGARRHAGGARGLPEASRPGRFAPRGERQARRGAAGAAAADHSRDVGHGDCARTLREVGARGTPDGWQAVPARRRVSTLCGKLGIDPTDLSPLGGQAGVPT